MARVKAVLSVGARLSDYLTVGFLAMNCPLDKVRKALDASARTSGGRAATAPIRGVAPIPALAR